MKFLIARLIVLIFVSVVVTTHMFARRIGGFFPRLNSRPRRVFMIGAFYSSGWLQAHAGPLSQSNHIDEVYVICDKPIEIDLAGVYFRCPSPWLTRWFGRGLARVVALLLAGWHLRPHVYIGYHIMPNAALALLGAALFNGKAIYQMTGGSIQIRDGGYRSESPLLQATGGPSRLQERALSLMVRRFDAVVVRGQNARKYVEENALSKHCVILTGAVDTDRFKPRGFESKDVDIVTVSRLVRQFKGLERFLAVVRTLVDRHSGLTAVIVGDGPAKHELQQEVEALGIQDNVVFQGQLADVTKMLSRAKVFVLLSPSEGMSIAMLEAMSAGLPVVVTDVGELGDALREHGGGVLVNYRTPDDVATHISALLVDPIYWSTCSSAARETIKLTYSTGSVSAQWDRMLTQMFHCDLSASRKTRV
jgi:glycosyltransferase involved in cell wall biosynthesis